jgi:hypothetical protein
VWERRLSWTSLMSSSLQTVVGQSRDTTCPWSQILTVQVRGSQIYIGGLGVTDFKWICDPTVTPESCREGTPTRQWVDTSSDRLRDHSSVHSVRVYVCWGVLVVSPSPCPPTPRMDQLIRRVPHGFSRMTRSDLLTTNQTVQV